MPQNPNDWVSIDKLNPPDPGAGINDWRPISTPLPQPQQQFQPKEPTLLDKTITGTARYFAPVAIPLAVDYLSGGLALPASTAIGGATALAGEGFSEWYEKLRGLRPSYNPSQLGIATLAGMIPPIGKPAQTILGAAAKGVVHGGGIGAALSFPQVYSEEGRIPYPSEIWEGTKGGALLGGLGGGAVHGVHKLIGPRTVSQPPNQGLPPGIPPPSAPPPQMRLPGMENTDFTQQIRPAAPPPEMSGLQPDMFPLDVGGDKLTHQRDLPISSWRSPEGKIVGKSPVGEARTGTPVTPETSGWTFPTRPTVEDMAPPSLKQGEDQTIGDTSILKGYEVISVPDPGNSKKIDLLYRMGFEPWRVGPDGNAQMRRKIGENLEETAFTKTARAKEANQAEPTIEHFNSDEPITFPSDKVNGPLIRKMKSQGYVLVNDDGQTSYFAPADAESPSVQELRNVLRKLSEIDEGGPEQMGPDFERPTREELQRPTKEELQGLEFPANEVLGGRSRLPIRPKNEQLKLPFLAGEYDKFEGQLDVDRLRTQARMFKLGNTRNEPRPEEEYYQQSLRGSHEKGEGGTSAEGETIFPSRNENTVLPNYSSLRKLWNWIKNDEGKYTHLDNVRERLNNGTNSLKLLLDKATPADLPEIQAAKKQLEEIWQSARARPTYNATDADNTERFRTTTKHILDAGNMLSMKEREFERMGQGLGEFDPKITPNIPRMEEKFPKSIRGEGWPDAVAREQGIEQIKQQTQLEKISQAQKEPFTKQEMQISNNKVIRYFIDTYGSDWVGQLKRASDQGTAEIEAKHKYVHPGVRGAKTAIEERKNLEKHKVPEVELEGHGDIPYNRTERGPEPSDEGPSFERPTKTGKTKEERPPGYLDEPGIENYRLPSGAVLPLDSSYSKGRPTIPIDMNDGTTVNAVRLNLDPKNRKSGISPVPPSWNATPTAEKPTVRPVRKTLEVGVDVVNSAENITRDYSSPIESIMGREGGQNALDAADKLGLNGKVTIRIQDHMSNGGPGWIEIHDNGEGLDTTTLKEKLATLFKSGKEDDPNASGGKGIGSASYMLGGSHFQINTVAVDSIDGKKYRIIWEGTPEMILPGGGPRAIWHEVQVPDSTPTGTTIKTIFKSDQDVDLARDMVRKIIDHSRDRPSQILYDPTNATGSGKYAKDISKVDASDALEVHSFTKSDTDKTVADFTYRNSDIKIQVPPESESPIIEAHGIRYHVLNNGMFQYSDVYPLPSKAEVPSHIIVNIEPKVKEKHNDYPFLNTREQVKDDFRNVIQKKVEETLGAPAVDKRKNKTQELYDSMTPVTNPNTYRKTVIYDPGKRFTSKELDTIAKNPATQSLLSHYDDIVNQILRETGRQRWMDRVEGVGLVFDPNMHGVHIPNPTTGKSTILFNPFLRMDMGSTPQGNAWNGTITNLHEVAHVGTETADSGGLDLSWSQDESNPRLGKYVQAFMSQLKNHADTGPWKDTGHKMDFIQRLSEVFSRYGAENTYAAADRLEHILTGGYSGSGHYSPEIQKLLQFYQERQGRPATTEDLLSSTGVKYGNKGPSREGTIPSNTKGPRGRIDTEGINKEKEKPRSWLREAYNFARAATTTLDLSAPLRQGSGMLLRKEWWKSWKQQIEALGSEEAYQRTLADLKARSMFQRTVDRDPNSRTFGKIQKSFAEQAGIQLSDVSSKLSRREEATASNWIETGGAKEMGEGNVAQMAYQKTIGRGTRATNRAYTAFLNQLRADSFENLVKSAHSDFKMGLKGARDPFTDIAFAKEIADYVNTATGRGPMRVALPSISGNPFTGGLGSKEVSLEQHAKFITDVLFSPRLMFSRVRMLNPLTYSMATPFVRKQYLKSLLGVGAMWGTVSTLAAGAGADVSTDPMSADFGKIRIGNTRLDPAGGFQQYLVAVSRFLTGHYTSSATGQTHEMGAGFQAETQKDIAERFMANKLHPVVKFAYDLANASQYQPFPVMDRTMQLFVPLIVGDIKELVTQDPSLVPWMAPLIATGMGSQTYSKGEAVSKFVPKENDWNLTNFAPLGGLVSGQGGQ